MKRGYCSFCQLALLNISLSVEVENDSQCNSFSSEQSNLITNMETILSNFQQKFALVGVFNSLPLNF